MAQQKGYAGRVKNTGAQSVKALYSPDRKQHGTVRRGEDLRTRRNEEKNERKADASARYGKGRKQNMAFQIHKTDDGGCPAWSTCPCGAIAPQAGMAMKMASGKLAAAAGTDLPTYLSVAQRTAPCEAGELIPVLRVQPDTIFEAPAPSGFTAVPGDRVQLGGDGLTLSTAAGRRGRSGLCGRRRCENPLCAGRGGCKA